MVIARRVLLVARVLCPLTVRSHVLLTVLIKICSVRRRRFVLLLVIKSLVVSLSSGRRKRVMKLLPRVLLL